MHNHNGRLSIKRLEEKAIKDVADASQEVFEYTGYPDIQIDIAAPSVNIPSQLDPQKVVEGALRALTAEQPPSRPSSRTIRGIIVGFERPNGAEPR